MKSVNPPTRMETCYAIRKETHFINVIQSVNQYCGSVVSGYVHLKIVNSKKKPLFFFLFNKTNLLFTLHLKTNEWLTTWMVAVDENNTTYPVYIVSQNLS